MTQTRTEELLDGPDVARNADIALMLGTYVSDKGHKYTLKRTDIVDVEQTSGHALGSSCPCPGSRSQSTGKLQGIRVYSDSGVWSYTWVLHPNGVVRFRINENLSLVQKMKLGYFDSEGILDHLRNMGHVVRNGCYCFGVLCKNGDIRRYNRWNGDCVYFTTFVKQDTPKCRITLPWFGRK
jgi:hypothetical protein